jgi:hypothetical protein
VKQHAPSSALLVAVLERLAARGPQDRTFLVCDPFFFTNADIDRGARAKHGGGVAVPVPLPWTEALLRRWPMFPGRDALGALAAFAFLVLNNEFDWRSTLDALAVDPAGFAREYTLDPYLASAL